MAEAAAQRGPRPRGLPGLQTERAGDRLRRRRRHGRARFHPSRQHQRLAGGRAEPVAAAVEEEACRPAASPERGGRRDGPPEIGDCAPAPRAEAISSAAVTVESRGPSAHTRHAMPQAMYSAVQQLDEFRWMLPKEGGMRVPGVLIADRPLLEKMLSDRTPDQVRNAAHLPGILEASIAMPDAHWGYGLPVGGVVATDPDEGVVSPGAVGYDIGCGVRLMKSRLTRADLEGRTEPLADALYREVPCGVGSEGAVSLAAGELDRVLREGSGWAVKRGLGWASDLEHCEEAACWPTPSPRR